ncbi:MAG: hypothetical protein QNL77_03585, partial [Akkermansiaceae bacterium]
MPDHLDLFQRFTMASYYEKGGIYYLRSKGGDGKWRGKSTGIKVESKGALRRVERLVSREQSSERARSKEGVSALFSSWVADWMLYKYKNPKTLDRYQGIWAHLTIFLKLKRVKHPAEMTYQLAH